MGPKSPISLPFLLCRRESSGYVDHHSIAPDVRAFVSGEIVCGWNSEVRKVGGGPAIKIAFNTTDLATAKARWSEAHVQVERLVGSATCRQRHKRLRVSRVELQRVPGPAMSRSNS